MRGNRDHFTGRWGVQAAYVRDQRQRLTAKDGINLFFYAQLTFRADMLLERHDVTRRQRNLAQRRAVRFKLSGG